MTMRRALQAILIVAVIGVCFSGVLTYREFFGGAGKCPAPGAPGTVFGYPACVYGFFMYLLVAGLAALGLRGKDA
jgi:ABC-type tungstate transport system substrate-binding protein